MRIFNVEKIPTQGGSLRVYISHKKASAIKLYPMTDSVDELRNEESNYDLDSLDTMLEFSQAVSKNIASSKYFINHINNSHKRIAGYGAAAKATIFINALGLDSDQICCVADINPVKQGSNIPGTDIPVVTQSELINIAPDYIIIFPWNLKDEISSQLKTKLPSTVKYIVFVPDPEVF